MTITLLQMTNNVLKRVRVIAGDTEALATDTTSTATGATASNPFVNSAHQSEIDIALQLINEAIMEVAGLSVIAPEVATATISLSTAQREYTMPSDFEQIAGSHKVLRGATKAFIVSEYPGGYEKMLMDQGGLASQYQGQPNYYAINPTTLQTIRFDTEPTSNENGVTLNTLYHKRLSRSSTMATEAMPYNDAVNDSLVPVVAEGFNAIFKKEFNSDVFSRAVTRAVERAIQTQRTNCYGPRQSF